MIPSGLKRSIEAIKAAAPIEQVAAEYTELRPAGNREYLIRCPMPDHEDRDPSCRLYTAPDDPHYHCYVCEAHGDVVDLEELCGRHAETWTAVVALSERYGVELPERSASWHEGQDRRCRYQEAQYRVLGNVLKRRLYKTLILPYIDLIEDSAERERELERSWREWDRSERWPNLAAQLLAGNEDAFAALAAAKADTEALVEAGVS